MRGVLSLKGFDLDEKKFPKKRFSFNPNSHVLEMKKTYPTPFSPTAFRITMETHLLVYLIRHFQKGITKEERHKLMTVGIRGGVLD